MRLRRKRDSEIPQVLPTAMDIDSTQVLPSASDVRVSGPAQGEPVVELRDVTRSFPGPPEVLALRGVNLCVKRGQYLSIIGPSGSGKSTLLNTLGLLDRPSVGSYRLVGTPTEELDETHRAHLRATTIAFVFQAFHLMPQRSVFENVLMGMLYSGIPRDQREERARRALNSVGMDHRVTFSPSTLSGGERQRVALARALALEPTLLLADEPTGNLDPDTSADVLTLFDRLHSDGLTLIVITHDSKVAARAERRVRISEGKLEEIA